MPSLLPCVKEHMTSVWFGTCEADIKSGFNLPLGWMIQSAGTSLRMSVSVTSVCVRARVFMCVLTSVGFMAAVSAECSVWWDDTLAHICSHQSSFSWTAERLLWRLQPDCNFRAMRGFVGAHSKTKFKNNNNNNNTGFPLFKKGNWIVLVFCLKTIHVWLLSSKRTGGTRM